MKYVQVIAVMTALVWTSNAWAQFGLYGSPGLVRLPKVQSQAPAPSDYPAAPYDAAVRPVAASVDAQPVIETAAAQPPRKPPKKGSAKKHPPKPRPKEAVKLEAPSVVDEMLGDSGRFPPPWGPDPGCAADDPWAGYGDCEDDCYDSCDSCLPYCEPLWYASLTGLVMGRGDKPNKVWTSYETADVANQLRHTGDDLDWRGGAEIRFGRNFCCGSWAVEAAYWTLDPFTGMSSQTHPNFVSTPLDFSDVVWADGGLAGLPENLFDRAQEHRVWRHNEVHSVEVSLIRHRMEYVDCSPFRCDWSVGARFFRFEEDLLFGSLDEGGLAFGIDPTMEGYLDDNITNYLVGAQFGCNLSYSLCGWRLFASPRFGIYNNHINHRFTAYRGDGELFAPAASTGYPPYPVSSTTNVVSFLTEIDLGLEWQFNPQWSATVGYRLTIATGMGLADHQIPPYVVDTPELADIDYNGYLLLHGGFVGVTYRF